MGNTKSYHMYRNGELSANDDRYFLKFFSKYDDEGYNRLFFEYQDPSSTELKFFCDTYDLHCVAGEGSEFEK